MKGRFFGAIFCTAGMMLLFRSVVPITAAPLFQNPTPTDEPTKRPYVFPTPIFIPTFVSATDLPLRSVTVPPRPTVPAAVSQTPSSTAATGQPAPTLTPAYSITISNATETPMPEPESDNTDLAQAAKSALLAMGVVIFMGFLVISGTAILVYRRHQRKEKVAAIKARLKAK